MDFLSKLSNVRLLFNSIKPNPLKDVQHRIMVKQKKLQEAHEKDVTVATSGRNRKIVEGIA